MAEALTEAMAGWAPMRELRLAALILHPIIAWQTIVNAQAQQADRAARDAGLTVEVLPGGARRYRDPALDSLAAYRCAPTTVSDHAAATSSDGWSPVRLVEAGWSS